MPRSLLTKALFIILLSACASASKNSAPAKQEVQAPKSEMADLNLPAELKPDSLTNLARTEDGGFVLVPGYYEAEFKTYCLQPGTPDPSSRDAYLQAPITGYRKEIVQNRSEKFAQQARNQTEECAIVIMVCCQWKQF